MRNSSSRRRSSLVSLPAVFLGRIWKAKTDRGGQESAEPFRIAGNFYYVGANDPAAFLITGPEGHVVLDGGKHSTAPMIMASIASLGFDIKDVKVLLNSEPRPEHAGGLAALQQASGAELWASEANVQMGDPRLPARARRPPVQRRRDDPCRTDRAHRAHHRR